MAAALGLGSQPCSICALRRKYSSTLRSMRRRRLRMLRLQALPRVRERERRVYAAHLG
jgi:hypothetical protein